MKLKCISLAQLDTSTWSFRRGVCAYGDNHQHLRCWPMLTSIICVNKDDINRNTGFTIDVLQTNTFHLSYHLKS